MSKRKLILVSAMLILLLSGAIAFAASQHAVDRSAVTAGGGTRSSDNYIMNDAIGEAVVGTSQGDSYVLRGGFLPLAATAAPTPTPGDSTPVTGITRQVNGDILPGVSITLDGIGPVVSDGNGYYEIMASSTGSKNVVAHKDGFRNQTRNINIAGLGQGFAVTCNFQAQYGLIPNAPNGWYVSKCVNLWLFPRNPDIDLDSWTVAKVVNAWLYPAQQES